MANYPKDLRYTKDHEWARKEGDLVRVGITGHAVEQLGDITLVDLPAKGTKFGTHERFGDIESVKAVSELFTPIAGEVVETNKALDAKPELVNEGAYDKGWMMVLKPSNPSEVDSLMDVDAYEKYVASLDH
ncbi:MAG: glycine cleavage system protein GcvH [Sandaracinaceae bacterium]|nr:glycine cleavage system protein GcvH [Sandaracinaceae bacterium]